MNTIYWLVINTLADCLENGTDREKVKSATLRLDMELDNLPIDEIKRLKSVLERINYEICTE